MTSSARTTSRLRLRMNMGVMGVVGGEIKDPNSVMMLSRCYQARRLRYVGGLGKLASKTEACTW